MKCLMEHRILQLRVVWRLDSRRSYHIRNKLCQQRLVLAYSIYLPVLRLRNCYICSVVHS